MSNDRAIELARLHLGPAHGPCRVTHAVDSELQTLYAAAYADGVKAAAEVVANRGKEVSGAVNPQITCKAILALLEPQS